MSESRTAAEAGTARDETRTRIVEAAAQLLINGGRDALTTRAVAAAVGLQAPAIYRLFGDKSGLIDAVAEHGFARYLAQKKHRKPHTDPVEELRAGWDLHVGFGLANPALFSIMSADPRPGAESPAAAAGYRILGELIHRVAAAGRLRVSEQTASVLVQASGTGTVLTLLTMPEDARDPALIEAAREAVVAAITTESPAVADESPVAAAVALRAVLPEATVLSKGERRLMAEWLDRLAAAKRSRQ